MVQTWLHTVLQCPDQLIWLYLAGFILPHGGFYHLAGGINLDLLLCTIPSVGPYKKQGEEVGKRGNQQFFLTLCNSDGGSNGDGYNNSNGNGVGDGNAVAIVPAV
jgi:hypothetical protein